MKRFLDNQYVSNIIIGFIFLGLSNVVPLIKSRINNESLAYELKLFWTFKIDLWVYVLTILILIIIFAVNKLLNKKSNFKYDSETIKVDRRLFQKIQ